MTVAAAGRQRGKENPVGHIEERVVGGIILIEGEGRFVVICVGKAPKYDHLGGRRY